MMWRRTVVDPQPKNAHEFDDAMVDLFRSEEGYARSVVNTLTAAGFRLVPPGWRVVKTETDGPTLGGQSYDVIVEEWDG